LFSARDDIEEVVGDVKSERDIKLVIAGMFESGVVRVVDSLTQAECADPGVILLVLERSQQVHVEEVPQRAGGMRYCVDQRLNPGSIVLRPGGMLDDNTLLAGQVGTVSENPLSVELYQAFSKAVRRKFTKVKSYWVGPGAGRLLDQGARLVATRKAPREYDLKR